MSNSRASSEEEPCGDDIDQFRLEEHLQETAKRFELSNPIFRITRGSKEGDNYMGVVYRAAIEGYKCGKKETVHAICKCIPLDEVRREIVCSHGIFIREIFFYEEVLPTFDDLLKEHGMRLEHFPILYGTSKVPGAELLILEDLRRKGYVMKTSKILDYPHVSLALRYLAQFHACSFAARVLKAPVFDKFKSMKEPLFSMKSHKIRPTFVNVIIDSVTEILADEESHYLERFNCFSRNLYGNMIEATDGSTAEPYAVVNHGDAWTNNMLFKYTEDITGQSTPQDLRFLDFQLSRYASPVLDIVYMLFCCCTKETRSENYDRLLRVYYESLSEYLGRLNCDIDSLFPYEVLLEHLQHYGKFAAGMALYVLHMFTNTKNQEIGITSNTDIGKFRESLRNNDLYRTMVRDTFKEMIDRNYI